MAGRRREPRSSTSLEPSSAASADPTAGRPVESAARSGRGADATARDVRAPDRAPGADPADGAARPTADVAGRPSPWRRRSRQVAYDNAWIAVYHDEVDRPDGSPGIYGVVHFKHRAVGVVAVDEAGRILLVGQHRYTLDEYTWEIPEGGVPEDEDPLDGAVRELEEETGFRAAEWRVLVPHFHTSNSIADETGTIYLATGLQPGEGRPEATEEIEVRWASLPEALAMIDRGEISDLMSIAGLLRWALEAGGGSGAERR